MNYVKKITLKKIKGKKDPNKIYTVLRVYCPNDRFIQTFVDYADVMQLTDMSPSQCREFMKFDDEIEI